jgi:hypothetical protein
MGGMTDFWKGLVGVAVLRPPAVWDNTSGRCLAETGAGAFGPLFVLVFVTGAGAFGLLFVFVFVLVLPAPLLATSVGRFRDNGREKKPCIPVVLEKNFRTFRKGSFPLSLAFFVAAGSLGAGLLGLGTDFAVVLKRVAAASFKAGMIGFDAAFALVLKGTRILSFTGNLPMALRSKPSVLVKPSVLFGVLAAFFIEASGRGGGGGGGSVVCLGGSLATRVAAFTFSSSATRVAAFAFSSSATS